MTPSPQTMASTVTIRRATRTLTALGATEAWADVGTSAARVRVPSGLGQVTLGRQPGQRRMATMHVPLETDVRPGDRVVHDAVTWHVTGTARQERGAFLRADLEEVV